MDVLWQHRVWEAKEELEEAIRRLPLRAHPILSIDLGCHSCQATGSASGGHGQKKAEVTADVFIRLRHGNDDASLLPKDEILRLPRLSVTTAQSPTASVVKVDAPSAVEMGLSPAKAWALKDAARAMADCALAFGEPSAAPPSSPPPPERGVSVGVREVVLRLDLPWVDDELSQCRVSARHCLWASDRAPRSERWDCKVGDLRAEADVRPLQADAAAGRILAVAALSIVAQHCASAIGTPMLLLPADLDRYVVWKACFTAPVAHVGMREEATSSYPSSHGPLTGAD